LQEVAVRELRGGTAVVTGGASGIGRAMVDRFAAERMNVVVADINEAAAQAAAGELRAAGHRAVGIRTDVSKLDEVRALADAALDAFGTVHVVCNNAGVVVGGRVEELTDDEWRWVVDVDLWGAVNGVRVFLPLIESQGAGHLVSTASTSGLVAPPFIAPYSVAKAGVIALMEAVRRELDARRSPIGASVLVPGPVDTPLLSTSRLAPPTVGQRSDTPEGRSFSESAASYLATTGKSSVEVAALVVEAIRANRFWIITHAEWADVLRRRVDALATTGMLTDRPGA
jgi:NAD(P)-dependent dehydrogenase (short-subunit alcohol dehydrogenase family)